MLNLTRSRALSFVLAYLVWILVSAGAAAGIWIWRSDLLGLLLRAHLDQYTYRFLDELSFYILVLGWLIFVIWSEAWHRGAAERGRLVVRARQITTWIVAILLAGLAVYWLVL